MKTGLTRADVARMRREANKISADAKEHESSRRKFAISANHEGDGFVIFAPWNATPGEFKAAADLLASFCDGRRNGIHPLYQLQQANDALHAAKTAARQDGYK